MDAQPDKHPKNKQVISEIKICLKTLKTDVAEMKRDISDLKVLASIPKPEPKNNTTLERAVPVKIGTYWWW
tara:strand:- start:3709 stop:3921 length:213 start_codon:yes stop_codon:yes gene_type:complete